MVEPSAPQKPLSTGAKILVGVIGVLGVVSFIFGGGFGSRNTSTPQEHLMVTDDTTCEWVVEAFNKEDPPKIRAIADYIRSLMINHEFAISGQLLERRDDQGKQRLYALPVGICGLKPTTSLYEQVINTYDRVWADEKKWIER